MSGAYLPANLRRQVRKDAVNRCGYCLVPQNLMYGILEFEHILPRAAGGKTERGNLWLACRLCNGAKADQTSCRDPATGTVVPLFDPRRQIWREHFRWSRNGEQIVGLTTIGRATVEALELNNPIAVDLRRKWVSVGWHPPEA